jgi:hypothetical protein
MLLRMIFLLAALGAMLVSFVVIVGVVTILSTVIGFVASVLYTMVLA